VRPFFASKLSRTASWLLGAGTFAVVLYLVAMNIFLRTRLFRNLINFSPETMRVDYASAYSLFPGRIHVDGLRIRGSDSMVQWILVLDHCDFRLWPTDVLKRRFHASHIRGDGASFRMRLRLEEEQATRKVVAALPPVPGFSDPPYLRIGPPKAPLTDADYNLVSIQLDDVVADHVREIWMHTLRLTGDMHVAGRWLFRPLRWLEVGPATVGLNTLNVSFGDRALATNLHGSVDLTIHPFDVRVPTGLGILEYFSARTRVSGFANAANVLESLAEIPRTRFARGEGPLDVEMIVDHGKLEAGSHAEISLAEAEVDTANLELEGAATAGLLVREGATGPASRVNLDLSNPRALRDDREIVRASSVSAILGIPNVDLAHFSDEAATFALDLRGIRADDVAPMVSPFLAKSGLDIRSRFTTSDGHFEGRLDEPSAAGELSFAIEDLSIERRRDRLTASVQGNIELDASSLRERRAILTGSRIALRHIVAKVSDVDVTAPSLRVRAKRAVIEDVRPDVVLDVDLPRADVEDLRELTRLLPRGGLVSLREGRGRASARVEVSLLEKVATGDLSLSADPIAVELGPLAIRGRAEARVARATLDWGTKGLALWNSRAALHEFVVTRVEDGKRLFEAPVLAARALRAAVGPKGTTGAVLVELPRGDFPDLAALAEMASLPASIRVEKGRGLAVVRGDVDLDSLSLQGDAQVSTQGLGVRIGSELFESNLAAHLEAHRTSATAELTDLSGSAFELASDDVHAEKWWARATAPEASLRLTGGVGLFARVRIEAKDASPAEAVVASVTGVPRWLLAAAPMDHLTAEGKIRAAPSFFEVQSLEARGGTTSVHVEYVRHDDDKQGAALVDVGALALGFKLGGRGPGFVLFGADSWFKGKVAAMRIDPRLMLGGK
jgi:hypothetical protein